MYHMFFMFLPLLVHHACAVTVMTSKGPIIGQRATDGNYTGFFGVPYALVDEDHPFEETLRYPYFSKPFNASNPSIKCPQALISDSGILQCLRLNIYVPSTTSAIANGSLPVFVWFHGGGLAFGSAGEYNAKHLVEEDIIVVTANYRLGPYGFLCTFDIKNQGLKDQKTALQWIKSNIQSFGGNPDKVTVGGESWGASTVDFLLYGDGYFNQAIMQSGSRFSYGVSTRKGQDAPIRLAARLGFVTTKYKDAIEFLNTANPIEVMRATRDIGYVFGVCEKPGDFKLNKKYAEKIRNTPILIGYNSKESFADFARQSDAFYETIGEELVNNLYKTFDFVKNEIRTLASIIWKFYLGPKSISKESMLEIIDLSSDFRVNYGVERSVTNYLSFENPKVYKYVFAYTGGSLYQDVTGVGAYHTEELPYLFEWGTPLKTEEQFRVRRWMIKMWTNFIKYGDPTPNDSQLKWLPTDLARRPYLHIVVPERSEMRNFVHQERMAFWDLMWTAYGKHRK